MDSLIIVINGDRPCDILDVPTPCSYSFSYGDIRKNIKYSRNRDTYIMYQFFSLTFYEFRDCMVVLDYTILRLHSLQIKEEK